MTARADRDFPFDHEPKRRSVRREPRISELDQGDDFALRQRVAVDRHSKPLIRFLRGQVRSEIDACCQALKVNAAIRRAVRERVLRHMDTDVVLHAGKGWVERKTGRRGSNCTHPETGGLSLQKRQPTPRKQA